MRESLLILSFFLLISSVNAQRDSIDITQIDSIIQVSTTEPLNSYYLIYKDGKCGLLVENEITLPIIYNSKYLEFDYNGSVAILTDKEPFTIFFPKDSTYLNIVTKSGVLINDDSLHTGFEIINFNDGRTIIEVKRIHKNINKANIIFPNPENQPWNTYNELYYIEKGYTNVVSDFSEKNSRFIPMGDFVVGIKPKNKIKKKYIITLYRTFDKTELYSFDWLYNIENSMIEGVDYEFKEKIFYKLWYINSKGKIVEIGFISRPEGVFMKKIK